MGTSAAELRREIAQTRGELSETIEALEEKVGETKESIKQRVSPGAIVRRKKEELRDRVMGVTSSVSAPSITTPSIKGRTEGQMARSRSKVEDISERAGETAGMVSEQAKAAPSALRERTGGNPMAAGLVAVGAGFLVANLLPPTDRERQAAERLRSQLEPVKQQASQIGKEVAGELQQSAQARAEQVKERASEAVQDMKEDAQGSAEEVKDQAQSAAGQVKQQGRRASRQVKQTAKKGDGQPPPRARRTTRAPGQPVKASV
jgi:gas vesicle protein